MYATSFESQVAAAQASVKRLLDTSRSACVPSDCPHEYADKYRLVELATRGAAAALLNVLSTLGLDAEGVAELRGLAETRAVTLRMSSEERCTFRCTTTREEESVSKHVTERTGFFAGNTTHKVVTTVTEHFWDFEAEHEIFAFAGADPAGPSRVVLGGRRGTYEIKTTGRGNENRHPRPACHSEEHLDVDLTWLLTHLDGTGAAAFSVDRGVETCRTPAKNADVEEALAFFAGLSEWMKSLRSYFTDRLFEVCPSTTHGLALSEASAEGTFCPVLALFSLEEKPAGVQAVTDGGDGDGGGEQVGLPAGRWPALLVGDFTTFLDEQKRSLGERHSTLAEKFPDPDNLDALNSGRRLVTLREAWLVVAAEHAAVVCLQHAQVVTAVEDMLAKQLSDAVGKELQPSDLDKYLAFHNRKLFRPEFAPQGFSYAVRRSPEHSPEGILSIETAIDRQPVLSCVRRRTAASESPLRCPLSASAEVRLFGTQYLHALIQNRFSGQAPARLELAARARQFSSFILLIGNIAAADVFEPTGALIVQNKDDLRIPLLLEALPTPKEFVDAIESLSPEQQRFCKAFRQMQLASTLFGVAIVQIKPQLEKLLNLPADALTKEIQLTQDLTELFIKFQVPSDLVSYDPRADASTSPLDAVKAHVASVQSVIAAAKAKELDDIRLEEEKKLREREMVDRRREEMLRQVTFSGTEGALPPPMPCAAAAPSMNRMAMTMGGSGGGGPGLRGALKKKMKARRKCAAPARRPQVMDMMASAPAPAPVPQPKPQQTPQQQQQQQQTPQQPHPQRQQERSGSGGVDYTSIPGELDKRFEALDEDNALRPTTIKPAPGSWSLCSQAGLLSSPKHRQLGTAAQKKERGRAFDLLDAITRSGALAVDHASVHVVLAATHCFDKTIINTLVQDNVNPIEKVERSTLIVAETIHGRSTAELVNDDQLNRIKTFSAPQLLNDAGDG